MIRKKFRGTYVRLVVSTPWPEEHKRVDEAHRRFIADGWREDRKTEAGQRSLCRSHADIDEVRRAAQKNPGLIFQCIVMSFDSNNAVLHVGIGATWVTRKIPACDALCSKRTFTGSGQGGPVPRRRSFLSRPPRTQPFRRKKRSTRRRPASRTRTSGGKQAVLAQPLKAKTAKAQRVSNRLVFHGLPAEVERCRALVLESLPVDARAAAKYATAGNEQYMVGTVEFTTASEPAFRAFNKLVARVPGVTVSLEYADAKSGQRLLLRAVDGKIVEHGVV